MKEIVFVAFGSVLGANFRFIIYKILQKYILIKDFSILIINTLASFFLGLFLSFIPQITSLNFSYQLTLFFATGFLGSLSTFSTFVYELFDMSLQFNFYKVFKLFFISIALGMISLAFGLFLGD